MTEHDYTAENLIMNVRGDDDPPGFTPLKDIIIKNPDRKVFVQTTIGEVWAELGLNRALDFIRDAGEIVCGFVRPEVIGDKYDTDRLCLELQGRIDFEYLLEDD